jgi:hypothetical protein
MKIFKADEYQDVSLANGLFHGSAQMVAGLCNFTA